MKKMYKYILIITLMMFGFVGEVRAETPTTLCSYVESSKQDKIEIRYAKDGGYRGYNVFVNDKFVHSFTSNTSEMTELINNGNCPKNVYWKGAGLLEKSNYCFDNDKKTCLSKNTYDDKTEGIIGLDGDIGNIYKDKIIDKAGFYISYEIIDSDCIDDESCYPLCHYSQKDYGKYAVIYYKSGNSIENQLFVMSSAFNGKKFLTYGDKLSGRAYISEEDRAKLIVNGEDKEIICPKNFYHDTNLYDDVCFDNNGWCETIKNFESDEYVGDTEVDNIDGDAAQDVIDIMNVDKENILSCSDATKRIEENLSSEFKVTEICSYAKTSSPTDEVRQFFIVSNGSYFRYFYYTYNISDGGSGNIREIVDKNDKNLNFSNYYTCSGIDNVYTAGNDDSTWSDDERWYKTDVRFSRMCHYNYAEGIYTDKINPDDVKDCKSLLGVDLVNEINSWLLYIKIAVPIIIIVMGSLDFGKAFISSDEDAMKKAQKKFIMRLIIGMVIFFIPTIVKALLNIANQVWGNVINDTCGITF